MKYILTAILAAFTLSACCSTKATCDSKSTTCAHTHGKGDKCCSTKGDACCAKKK